MSLIPSSYSIWQKLSLILSSYLIDSIQLVIQLSHYIRQVADDFHDDNPLIIIDENDMYKVNETHWTSVTTSLITHDHMDISLRISCFPTIQFLYSIHNSCHNISTLIISNLPELQLIVLERNSFYSTETLSLLSLFIFI